MSPSTELENIIFHRTAKMASKRTRTNTPSKQTPAAKRQQYFAEEDDELTTLQNDYSEEDSDSEPETSTITEENLIPVVNNGIGKNKKIKSSKTHYQSENGFEKKQQVTLRHSKGNRSIVLSKENAEFDADAIDPMDCCDKPRQVILKKKHFPTQMIAIVVGATRVNFSKDKEHTKRLEIVLNIRFLFDLLKNNLVREISGGESIDYSGIEFRFHLPKRYQDAFENAFDLSNF